MIDCIFCDIAQKKIRSKIVYEDDTFLAFENISPSAPVHILVIPKEHIEKTDAISGKNPGLWDGLIGAAHKIIKKFELDKAGYKLVNNGAGYHHVDHEHIHVLGGKGWKIRHNP